MTRILFAGFLSILAVTANAQDCSNLVKKIYECGERASYSLETTCDSGDSFSDVRTNEIDDLATETVTQTQDVLRCDFSYPTSYTERCYGEVLQENNQVKLLSYSCFDLETGKKIYSNLNQ